MRNIHVTVQFVLNTTEFHTGLFQQSVITKIEKGYLQQEYTVQCPLSHKKSVFLLPLDASTVS